RSRQAGRPCDSWRHTEAAGELAQGAVDLAVQVIALHVADDRKRSMNPTYRQMKL
ncbi:hypothetical protein G9P95_31040, partial [Klebsiella pneumoniae]|nr:hypothetical protein [Klebsiella pneumoniae]